MTSRIRCLVILEALIILGCWPVCAQLRPQKETEPAKKKPSKPTQIVVQTSPDAEIYLDDEFSGRASSEGRLVIPNPKSGDHTVRISQAGKEDYEKQITVKAGEVTNVNAALADLPPPTPTAGQIRENSRDGLKYVWIPPGNFMMGCSPSDSECGIDEKPSHQVTITKGFWLGQTPVTVAAYRRYSGASGKDMPPAPDFNSGWSDQEMPIVNVSWDDAVAFCAWAGGRLPTEAEWEYAARAGSTESRYGPIDEVAWYEANSGGKTHLVAQKRPNGFKLYDMLGNVWGWVNDWYGENYYAASPDRDPQGPPSGQFRVLRGGSWVNYPRNVRVSYRPRPDPGLRNYFDGVGFRCVGEVGSP